MNRAFPALITLENVSYSYKTQSETVPVLNNISIAFDRQQQVGLMGASGVGKSTLLNILGLLDAPQSGSMIWNIDKKSIETTQLQHKKRALFRGRHIGFIHQSHYLLSEFTALENVMIPQMIVGEKKERAKQRAWDLLEQMQITDRAHHRPGQLSGGQKQRVSIARALANRPDLVLADEPTGNLDGKIACEVLDVFKEICKKHKTCMIMATHDVSFKNRFDRIIDLGDGALWERSGIDSKI